MYKVYWGLLLVAGLGACKNAGETNDPRSPDFFKVSDSNIVYLSTASSEQLTQAISQCPENANGHQQCFVICHVPPGNPNNKHSLIVPLPAIEAHLNHSKKSHSKNPHTGDYLGACEGNSCGDCSPTGEDGSTTGDENGSNDNEPVFCEWSIPEDLDCDGNNDETDEPLF